MSFFTPLRRLATTRSGMSSPRCDEEEKDHDSNSAHSSPPHSPSALFADSPSFLRLSNKSQIGTSWSVEMNTLKGSMSVCETATSLSRIKKLLIEVDEADRIKFCMSDFVHSINHVQRCKCGWSDEIFQLYTNIMSRFFDQNKFNKLPTIIIKEILMWLPIDEFYPVMLVSKEWNILGNSDEVWNTFYRYKFLRVNTLSAKTTVAVGNYLSSFRSRLSDPHIGDRVEVAWRGKFRLEASEVYQGLGWWVAEVVDKHETQGKYKIRYPGWESRWDEWVPRSRLRWAVDSNIINRIQPNDIVELWCCGANVPGAWLEASIRSVRGDKYCVGRVLSSGYGSLWVDRDRLRIAKPTRCLSSYQNLNNQVGSISSIGNTSNRSMRFKFVTDAIETFTSNRTAAVMRGESSSCVIA